MSAAAAEEGTLALKDGITLYTKTWKPADGTPTKARAVLLHGFRDHCSSYEIFSSTLASRGIEVCGYDQRGWGKTVKSPTDRGRGGTTEVIMDDLSQLLQSLLPTPVPLFLCGHSMGGGIVLTYAARGPLAILTQLSGYVIWAPLLQLHPQSAPSRPLLKLLSFFSHIFPHLAMPQKISVEVLSRDPKVQKDFEEDKLNHPMATLEGLWGMLERGKKLMQGAVSVDPARRIWVGHGTGDRLTDSEASKKWVGDVFGGKNKELKLYEGWKHKHNDKITFANDIANWILVQSSTPATTTTTTTEEPEKPEPKSKL
ncbi:MAG: hypothetical protein M1840_000850 [Geoglossum simile]|nr:MAG: hypothetical protein M1840_000850 [Geoglossum simile]